MEKIRRYIYEMVAAGKLSANDASKMISKLQKTAETDSCRDIAIIGIAGRFAKAENIEQFWMNIRYGKNCIDSFPDSRLKDACGLYGVDMNGQYKKGGFLDEISFFDGEAFRISPREALAMEPYQRIMLETAYETLNNAGYGTKELKGSKTGVFIGKDHVTGMEYRNHVENSIFSLTGSWPGILASRISYVYDLKGPSIVVDTACSSGLAGLHLAYKSLQQNECSMAFVGGISGLNYFPNSKKDSLLNQVESKEEIIRAFDKDADGTVWGEGVGGLLLKPLDKALADGDYVYAVIKGSGINNNGLAKGITAPNGEAQTKLLKNTWKEAQIDPETIQYIEAHGTGTSLGDTIELESIVKALQAFTNKKQFCGVGTVKTNIGHCVGASGIIALIKAIYILRKREIPPMLNYNQPNTYLDLMNSPIYISDKLRKLETHRGPLRVGINSFGFSGTNCHVVLEEAPQQKVEKNQNEWKIFVCSARSNGKLISYVKDFSLLLLEKPTINLESLCYSASVCREHHTHRIAILFRTYRELLEKIELFIQEKTLIYQNRQKHIFFGMHITVSDNKLQLDEGEIREGEIAVLNQKADSDMRYYSHNKLEQLELAAGYYVKGADINWKMFYRKLPKCIIPSNPLERVKYWPDHGVTKGGNCLKQNEDIIFELEWRLEPLHRPDMSKPKGNTILVTDSCTSVEMESLFQGLKLQRDTLTRITIKEKDSLQKENSFQIHDSMESYFQVFEQIEMESIDQIVYMCPAVKQNADSVNELRHIVHIVVDQFLSFVYALNEKIQREVDFVIITHNAQLIFEEDGPCNNFQHILAGIGRSIRQENLYLKTRCIDIDENDIEQENLLCELQSDTGDYAVALRQGQRYIETINRKDITKERTGKISIDEGEVYVITGGLGRIGQEICRFLAQTNHVTIIVLGRTALPERTLWDTIDQGETCYSKLCCMLEVEKLGSGIKYYSVDICNESDMNQVIQKIVNDYGKINGVFHCAGVGVGQIEGFISDSRQLEQKWAPKITGSWTLYKTTKVHNDGFYVLFSSLVTITGGKGTIGYAVGNSYLDSFAQTIKRDGKKVMLINWPSWKDTVDVMQLDEKKQYFEAISNHQAIQVLKWVLDNGSFQTIVGRFNRRFLSKGLERFLPFRFSNEVKEELNSSEEVSRVEQKKNTVNFNGYSTVQKELVQIWSDVLGVSSLSIFDSFYKLGGDSIQAAFLFKELDNRYPGKFKMTDIYKYCTIQDMADYIETQCETAVADNKYAYDEKQNIHDAADEMAIIGYACKFPFAEDANQFWSNLRTGRIAIREFPESRRKDIDGYSLMADNNTSQKYSTGGYLEQIDLFDPAFFQIAPKEAEMITPEQRMLLENIYQAIEQGGLGGNYLSGKKVGVYIGKDTSGNDEYKRLIEYNQSIKTVPDSNSIMASRIAYFLNLKGPCMLVDTACSSGLSSICLAVQALVLNKIDMAIISGTAVSYLPLDNKSLLDSKGGRIYPFDFRADGIVWGEGIGTIIVKPLKKAIADKNIIHGVIKGCAFNNSGISNGITSPNAQAQTDVIVEAWKEAKINPETISYVETQGIGSKMGDSIEIEGLTNAFRLFTDKKQFCGIGSVKPNIGHLVGASGIASVIKMLLAFKHQELPPMLNFERPSDYIDFPDTPVYINDKLTEWKKEDTPRRCGISTFGMSGTNCHIILEEPPANNDEKTDEKEKYFLFTLSAKTKQSLEILIRNYYQYLNDNPKLLLSAICCTAGSRRGHYAYRLAAVINRKSDLLGILGSLLDGNLEQKVKKHRDCYYGYHKVVYENNQFDEHLLLEEDKVKLSSEAVHNMNCNIENGILYEKDALKKLADFYIKGADIPWVRMYQAGEYQSVELPPYPFDSKRYWIQQYPQDMESIHPMRTGETEGNTVNNVNSIKSENPLVLTGRKENKYSLMEIRLAAIWREVLGVNELDIYMPFSEIGGNSILAISLAKRISQELHSDFNVNMLFAYPSIAKSAQYLEKSGILYNETVSVDSTEEIITDKGDLKNIINGFVDGQFSIKDVMNYLEKGEGED